MEAIIVLTFELVYWEGLIAALNVSEATRLDVILKEPTPPGVFEYGGIAALELSEVIMLDVVEDESCPTEASVYCVGFTPLFVDITEDTVFDAETVAKLSPFVFVYAGGPTPEFVVVVDNAMLDGESVVELSLLGLV